MAVRDHQDFGLVDAALRAIAITVAIAVTAVTDPALHRLGERCSQDPGARRLETIQRFDRRPRPCLAAFDDKESGSGGGREQWRVGKPEAGRTVDDDEVEAVANLGDDLA